jgi:phosphoheptose isomerase
VSERQDKKPRFVEILTRCLGVDMEQEIRELLSEAIAIKQRTLSMTPLIAQSAELLIGCLKQGGKILVCGNGGSAADAQHLAGELVGRFEVEREGVPCIALTTDSSVLTAWANDYSYETVFARQVNALGRKEDVLVAISTSGVSKNIICAVEAAKKKGLKTIALTGKDGGTLKKMDEVFSIVVPSHQTSRIQEVHITIIHIWCKLIEGALFV